jgi:hypothetical protein
MEIIKIEILEQIKKLKIDNYLLVSCGNKYIILRRLFIMYKKVLPFNHIT